MADVQPNLRLKDTECTTILTTGQTLGLFIAAEVGLASGIAVLFLFGRIIRNVFRNYEQLQAKDWRFFKTPMDVYMLSLFASELLHALGSAINIKWVAQGTVSCSPICTTQGVLQLVGTTGVALATLAIAVHTFCIIFFRRGRRAIRLATIVVCVIWLYLITFVVVGEALHHKQGDDFFTPTPFWCWVSARFTSERLVGEYIWLWLAAFISLLIYIPLFLCLRGIIWVNEGEWKRCVSAGLPTEECIRSEACLQQAPKMLLYPACYVTLVMPLSVARWIGLGDNGTPTPLPSSVTFASISILGLSGLVNVILVIWTRPRILLIDYIPNDGLFASVKDTRRRPSATVQTIPLTPLPR